MHWHQKVPRPLPDEMPLYDDVYLVIPRIFHTAVTTPASSSCQAKLPDDCVVAEGTPWRFCVTDDDDPTDQGELGENPAPDIGTPCPRPSPPSPATGTATFGATDQLYPGIISDVQEHCFPQSHHWVGTVNGMIAPDPESDPLQPLSGEFELDARMGCEQLGSGTGHVDGLSVTADGLDFEFLNSLQFVRVGSEVTVEVSGICTTADASYVCELTLSGSWVPRRLDDLDIADIISGALVVTYEGEIDTWEDWEG